MLLSERLVSFYLKHSMCDIAARDPEHAEQADSHGAAVPSEGAVRQDCDGDPFTNGRLTDGVGCQGCRTDPLRPHFCPARASKYVLIIVQCTHGIIVMQRNLINCRQRRFRSLISWRCVIHHRPTQIILTHMQQAPLLTLKGQILFKMGSLEEANTVCRSNTGLSLFYVCFLELQRSRCLQRQVWRRLGGVGRLL